MAKSKRQVERIATPTRYEFETFQRVGAYEASSLKSDEPSCFNGIIRVRKWRVVFEQIDEPQEVIQERILKLWRTCDNHRHQEPLRRAAATVGLELDGTEFGVERKR